MPKIARGTSGSSTRTTNRNIMVFKATAVSRIITIKPSAVDKLKMVPTPASSDPTTVITAPTITALIALAAFSPRTSSVFVMGVTR